ncbi:MAG: ABC transporter substrate-binding protein [Rhodospirillales bacterium]
MNRKLTMGLKGGLAALALTSMLALTAPVQAAGVKIGLLSDMSGPNADLGGKGSVVAAEMAIGEFGGKVLGQPIELIQADMQSKPDLAVAIARRWYENEGVNVIVDINNSTAAIAINKLALEFKKINMVSQAATTQISREQCTPYSFQYGWNLYALAAGAAHAIVKSGGKSWYFISVDYTFGHDMQKVATNLITADGGSVVGSSLHPLNTNDFSSLVLKAKNSKADVVVLNNSGQDLKSSLRQAQEFGIAANKQRLAAFVVTIADVNALGLDAAQGLTFVDSFYWDKDDATRAWSKKFFARFNKMPTAVQASIYSATRHYLKSVQAAGTADSDAVVAKMKSLPVDDMYAKGKVRADGLLEHDMLLVQVKKPSESKYPWDYYNVLATIPGKEAYQPMDPTLCKILAK